MHTFCDHIENVKLHIKNMKFHIKNVKLHVKKVDGLKGPLCAWAYQHACMSKCEISL